MKSFPRNDLSIVATFRIISQLQSATLIYYSEWMNLLFSITRNAMRCAPKVQNLDVIEHYYSKTNEAQAWYCTTVNERSHGNRHSWTGNSDQLKITYTLGETFELAQTIFFSCTPWTLSVSISVVTLSSKKNLGMEQYWPFSIVTGEACELCRYIFISLNNWFTRSFIVKGCWRQIELEGNTDDTIWN